MGIHNSNGKMDSHHVGNPEVLQYETIFKDNRELESTVIYELYKEG